MADQEKPQNQPVRRRFMALMGIGGAVAATALASRAAPAEAMTPPAGKGGSHYRDSAHVKQYYAVNRY